MFRPFLARFGPFRRGFDPSKSCLAQLGEVWIRLGDVKDMLAMLRPCYGGLGHVLLDLTHLGELLAYLCKNWAYKVEYWLELSPFK